MHDMDAYIFGFKSYVLGQDFSKQVKSQGHGVKTFGSEGKVSSQGMHMCNMEAQSFLVWFKSYSQN